jgi:hypothetical protein
LREGVDHVSRALLPPDGILDGLRYDELREILQAIARRSRIVGIDVVEVSPPLDPPARRR